MFPEKAFKCVFTCMCSQMSFEMRRFCIGFSAIRVFTSMNGRFSLAGIFSGPPRNRNSPTWWAAERIDSKIMSKFWGHTGEVRVGKYSLGVKPICPLRRPSGNSGPALHLCMRHTLGPVWRIMDPRVF